MLLNHVEYCTAYSRPGKAEREVPPTREKLLAVSVADVHGAVQWYLTFTARNNLSRCCVTVVKVEPPVPSVHVLFSVGFGVGSSL